MPEQILTFEMENNDGRVDVSLCRDEPRPATLAESSDIPISRCMFRHFCDGVVLLRNIGPEQQVFFCRGCGARMHVSTMETFGNLISWLEGRCRPHQISVGGTIQDP